MFTFKGIFLFITIILLIATAWNTDITMIYVLFVIAFVIFALSFIHLQFNIPKLSITREIQSTAYEDDVINVKIDVRNNRLIGAYFFELVDRFPCAAPGQDKISLFILDLKGRERKIIYYAADCYKRGLWKIGPVFLVSQDMLGFFRKRKVINILSEILVYPSLFKIFAFPPLASGSVSWLGVETAKISGDSHEFFGVREYQNGDALSRIHWPSTARHNRLIVKQFERNALQEVTIVIDLKKGQDIGIGRETTLEYSVKIAGSIARHLLTHNAFIQMIAYRKEAHMIPFGKGEPHMYRILEYLAQLQGDGDFSLSYVLEEATFFTPPRSTLITVMLDNDIDSLVSLVQFKVKAIKLIVVVLDTASFGRTEGNISIDKEKAKQFDESLASLEAYVYRISKGDDLKKKFETV